MRAIAIALLFLLSNVAAAQDSCDTQMPGSLREALSKAFPNFRAPLANDNLTEDIQWDLKEGGKGCLGLAIADFDGDGTNDVVAGLTPLQGAGGLIVVALARDQGWQLHKLGDWRGNRSTLYVSAGKWGSYARTEALDGPLEEGELDPLRCSHAAVIFGQIESSGVAYCYDGLQWQHVWISD